MTPLLCELLRLGGEDAFEEYRAAFHRLYETAPLRDVLKRLIAFPETACRHVCFKEEEGAEKPMNSGRFGARRVRWVQERAERIPWIGPALTHPGIEIRPDKEPNRQTCALLARVRVSDESGATERDELFAVIIAEAGTGEGVFVTAFPMERRYWEKARRAGPRLYPPPEPPKAKKRKRR